MTIRSKLTPVNVSNFLYFLQSIFIFYLGEHRDVIVHHLQGSDACGQFFLSPQQRVGRNTAVSSWWESHEADEGISLFFVLNVRHDDPTSTRVQRMIYQVWRWTSYTGYHRSVRVELNRPCYACNFRWS